LTSNEHSILHSEYNAFLTKEIEIVKMLSTLLRLTNFQNPLLRTLVPTVAAAYAIQGLAAVPSIAAQTERFYDLSGSLTYLSCTALSLYLPHLRARAAAKASGGVAKVLPNLWHGYTGNATGHWDWRQLALSAAVAVWASRCMLSLSISNHNMTYKS
jgi:hypothetical protein